MYKYRSIILQSLNAQALINFEIPMSPAFRRGTGNRRQEVNFGTK